MPIFGEKTREKRKTKEEKRGTGKLMVDQGSMLAGKKKLSQSRVIYTPEMIALTCMTGSR